MPGRISSSDIAAIREQVHIEDVVSDYVQLARVGSDSLKGLCPFHNEKTPSFHVRPHHGLFHCFGCGEGGDVYTFIQKIECVSFTEAVEILANRIGYSLTYENSSRGTAIRKERGTKTRLIAANMEAAQFYTQQLDSPEAQQAREFLQQRNFDNQAIQRFGCGFAPSGWDQLTRHLQRKGFEFAELEAAGLSRLSRNRPIDRFHRRLLWPIRSSTGEVVGFGARRIFDDDPIQAKYINTPETILYKKSRILFGIDLAKRDIAHKNQAVIVEGYTDVMAMHLAGITTAVAACGTSFGDEHLNLLRRLMKDDNIFRSKIIYVFDGDQAGQAAALKALEGDQQLVGRSFVAIIDKGMDPCDLRLTQGDTALENLVSHCNTPLIGFAISQAIDHGENIRSIEDQVAALHQCIPLLARIKDPILRDEYIIKLAGWINWDVNKVAKLVKQSFKSSTVMTKKYSVDDRDISRTNHHRKPSPRTGDAYEKLQREALKIALQYPELAGPNFDTLTVESFPSSQYGLIWKTIEETGGTLKLSTIPCSTQRIDHLVQHSKLGSTELLYELAVETIWTKEQSPDWISRYAGFVLGRLRLMWVDRQIAEAKAQLQRMSPVKNHDQYYALFEDLIAMESYSRSLQERARSDDFDL